MFQISTVLKHSQPSRVTRMKKRFRMITHWKDLMTHQKGKDMSRKKSFLSKQMLDLKRLMMV
jgi:hypothetical protein